MSNIKENLYFIVLNLVRHKHKFDFHQNIDNDPRDVVWPLFHSEIQAWNFERRNFSFSGHEISAIK